MYSIESMIAVIQCYIKIRKDVDIAIKVSNHKDIRQLKQAHEIAKSWLTEYNFKIL